MIMKLKREAFHVQLRRNHREEIFAKKRNFDHNQSTQKPLLELNTHVSSLINQFKYVNLQVDHLQIWPYIKQAIQIYLNDIEQSMLMINDDEREMSKILIDQVLCYLIELTYNSIIKFNIEELLDQLISILNVTDNDFDIIDKLCTLFTNILVDFQVDAAPYLLYYDIVEKLAIRFLDCNVSHDLIKVKQLFMVLSLLEPVGYREFKQIHPLLHRLQNNKDINDKDYIQILELYFRFIGHCTDNYDNLSKKQLFELLIEFQYIRWAVDLLFKYQKYPKLVIILYDFLINMTFGDSCQQLIQQGVLSIIQVHINDDSIPQAQVFTLLTNILIDDFKSIYDCGILTRLHQIFEQRFDNQQYFYEILYCIINVFVKYEELDYLKELIKMRLANCLITYITDYPIELIKYDYCQQIFDVFVMIFKTQSKKSKYNLQRELKNNVQFIMRVGKIYELSSNNIGENIQQFLFS